MLSMEPPAFCSAWFTCRRVCRTFKVATEQAAKSQIRSKIKISADLDTLTTVRVNEPSSFDEPSSSMFYRDEPVRTELQFLFGRFSEDGTRAIFQYNDINECEFWRTCQGDVQARYIEVLNNDGQFASLHTLCQDGWKALTSRYLDGLAGEFFKGPYIEASGLLHMLPYMDKVEVNYDKNELAIPWMPMVSILVARETKIEKELKLAASQDLERTTWTIPSSSSVEQGLRLALCSDIVRQQRFAHNMSFAQNRIDPHLGYERGRHTISLIYIYSTSSWYGLWLRQIRQASSSKGIKILFADRERPNGGMHTIRLSRV